MKVTYNEFVDNGLYVASHYLKKDISSLTVDDLKNNIDLFANKVYEFMNCEKYKKIADMAFHNSCYTQAPPKDLVAKYKENAKLENIKNQFRLFFNNLGEEEVCDICNEKHIKIDKLDKKYVSALSRSLMPNLTSNTFFNYSNNLQKVNVCPVCLFLSMISLLNMRKSGNLVLYNSEDSEFMKDLTRRRQRENEKDIMWGAEEVDKGNTINLQNEVLTFIDERANNNQLIVYVVNNSGQSQTYQEHLLTEKNLELFKKVYTKGYIEDFNKLNLFRLLLNNSIADKYMYYFVNFETCSMKGPVKLFELIEEEVSVLKTEVRELIARISKEIYDMTSKDDIKKLKSISNYNAFETYLVDNAENYKEKCKKNLLTEEEFEILTNYKNWQSIRTRMRIQFILLKGEQNVRK